MNEEHEPECDLSVDIDAIWRRVKKEENRADKAEAELAALKKDARICAYHLDKEYQPHPLSVVGGAARRIIEATKEGE